MRQRLLVALALIPLTLGAILLGGWFFAVFLTLAFTLAAGEYAYLAHRLGLPASPHLLVVGVGLVLLGAQYDDGIVAAFALALIPLTVYHLWHCARGEAHSASGWLVSIAGVTLLGVPGALLLMLRSRPDGLWWLMLVVPAVVAADTGAYFAGKRFGRHRISPNISPGKTWEGLAGGVGFSLLVTGLIAAAFASSSAVPDHIAPGHGLALAVLLSIAGLFGDLAISMLKREAGLKDTGGLLANMGGILDRIDSWLPAIAVAWLYVRFLIQP